jgi:polar amino acid transport system substrate-binding protein
MEKQTQEKGESMKRRTSLAVLVFAMCALVACLTGCSQLQQLGIGSQQEAYTPQKNAAVVSSPTIGEDGVLRVGVSSSNAPFSTQANGKLAGIDVDVAAALATQMGLDLQLVDVGADAEGALKDGSVDIVMGLSSDDASSTTAVTNAYLPTAVALFSIDATGLPSKGEQIEAQSASMSAWEVSNQYGDTQLKSASDLKSAFTDLVGGQVNYVASDAIVGTYVSHSMGADARIVGLMQKVDGYRIGVGKSNADLQTAVSNALSTISQNGTIDVIEQKWLGDTIDLSGYALTPNAEKAASIASSSSSSSTTGA